MMIPDKFVSNFHVLMYLLHLIRRHTVQCKSFAVENLHGFRGFIRNCETSREFLSQWYLGFHRAHNSSALPHLTNYFCISIPQVLFLFACSEACKYLKVDRFLDKHGILAQKVKLLYLLIHQCSRNVRMHMLWIN